MKQQFVKSRTHHIGIEVDDLTSTDCDTWIEESTALLLSLANPNRLAILRALVKAEHPVGVLAVKVGLSRSALSPHMAKLRTANLVRRRREAQTIFYTCTSPEVIHIISTLEHLFAGKGRKF